ncbi:zinc finger protein 503-like [Glandiceps talaboti]
MSNLALVKPLEYNEEKPRFDPERQAKRLPVRAIRMLSTRSQHILHAEYLQPLPNPPTYDAKKSPLALLAQTCSSIGKPDPPRSTSTSSDSKPLSFDTLTSKSTSNEKSNTTVSVSVSRKSSFTPYKQSESHEGDAEITKVGMGYPSVKARTSPVTVVTPTLRTEGKPAAAASPIKKEILSTSAPSSPKSSRDSPPSSQNNHISHTGISLSCGSMHVEVNHHESNGKMTSPPSSGYKPASPGAGAQAPPTLVPVPAAGTVPAPATSVCGCSPQVIGHAIPLVSDPNSASPTMRAAMAAAAQCAPSKNGLSGSPLMAASAPYTTAYARVRTSDGGTTLMPICSDPYCKNCQSAQISAAAAAAAANCTQCRHDTGHHHSLPSLNGAIPLALQLAGTFPTYALPNGASTTTPSYLYPHTMALPAATALPAPGRDHVCNWVSGTTSCGKRFATSEELLQHLRTHTMSNSDSISTHTITTSLAGALNPCHFYYAPTAATSPATALARSGLTGGALSPLSTLRYHPYKPNGLSAAASPAGAAFSSIPLPTAAYYSPYPYLDLKQRLPTAVPH